MFYFNRNDLKGLGLGKKMKTKQYLPVGVVWDKVAIVLDTGLTVKK